MTSAWSGRSMAMRTISDHLQPHDRAFGLAPRDFLESGGVEHRLGAEPHVGIRGSRGLVDGIRLDELHLSLAAERDGLLEHLLRNALLAVFRRDDETDDRPHLLAVHRTHHFRVRKTVEILAR